MSGRFTLAAAPEAVAAQFGVDVAWFPPRYNIAPGQPIAIVREVRGRREAALVRWGFVPSWTKDPRRYGLLINARAEGLRDKPAFRGAIQYRRCLIPATGYYHWERAPGAARVRPWFIRPRDGRLSAFAGLWDPWLGADGSEIDGAAIVTVAAGPDIAGIADRMPAVVLPADYARWLDTDRHPAAAAMSLLVPAPADSLVAVPVGERVNRVGNDGPDLIEPAAGGAA